MHIAVVGASGAVGECVVRELHQRGHAITGISTHPESVLALERVVSVRGDANDPETLTGQLRGHDVVVSSIRFKKTNPSSLMSAVKSSGVPRYVVVGGSGTLLVPGTTTRIMDTEFIPTSFAVPAEAAAKFFDALLTRTDINWTYLSPPPDFGPGERTGSFRLGQDELLVDANGRSRISYADYAVALADEIEEPQFQGRRFTVAY